MVGRVVYARARALAGERREEDEAEGIIRDMEATGSARLVRGGDGAKRNTGAVRRSRRVDGPPQGLSCFNTHFSVGGLINFNVGGSRL